MWFVETTTAKDGTPWIDCPSMTATDDDQPPTSMEGSWENVKDKVAPQPEISHAEDDYVSGNEDADEAKEEDADEGKEEEPVAKLERSLSQETEETRAVDKKVYRRLLFTVLGSMLVLTAAVYHENVKHCVGETMFNAPAAEQVQSTTKPSLMLKPSPPPPPPPPSPPPPPPVPPVPPVPPPSMPAKDPLSGALRGLVTGAGGGAAAGVTAGFWFPPAWPIEAAIGAVAGGFVGAVQGYTNAM